MTNAIVAGSLAAVAEQKHQTLAESFLTSDAIVLVDVSSSMQASDAPNGQTRYRMACDELARVQRELPGKVAVVVFANDVQFIPGGQPPMLGGSTNLADGLRFVQPADGTVKFVVISDGQPDSEEEALSVARHFESVIDTIFVGAEGDVSGRSFLARLSKAAGGKTSLNQFGAGLGAEITKMLTTG